MKTMTTSRPLSRARAPRPHRLALALAASSLLTLPQVGAQVLPSGPAVAAGQAQIAVNGGNMTVTNAANTILNWNSFSIGAANAVRFQQPNAASQVLNRVTGNDPSSILGQLSSNGKVWLLNPNGVLFGQGARIDVGGLVTSTLRLNDADWLAGRYAFSAGALGATVVNQGELRSTLGGRVVLLGGSVRNEGLIDAPGGQVLLAAGDSMELIDTGAPNLTVRLTASQGEALNLGTLRASGGRIDVHAAVVNQRGLVQADALSAGPGGEIVLQASTGRLSLADGSATSATAVAGQGGSVKLLGREVGLFGNARVDASGASGGGQVRVGGGLQGQDTRVPNADAVYFGRDAQIKADATVQGDGGRVILWSDHATRAFGSLSARGGAQGGDGGFIETSGGWLDARPLVVDVGAAQGTAGQWLLDPYNITISDSESDYGYDASFTATADSAQINTATIAAALNAGTNVTVSTGGGGTQAGTINMDTAHIAVTGANPGSLTLSADAGIILYGSSISSSGGAMPVSVLAGRSGTGSITLQNTSIRTAGGNLLLGGYSTGLNPDGGSFDNAAATGVWIRDFSVLDASTGRLEINSAASGQQSAAIYVGNGNSRFTGSDIVLRGYSADASGVVISDVTMVASHGIDIQGRGAGTGVRISSAEYLTLLSVAPSRVDSTAALALTGRSDGTAQGVLVRSAPNLAGYTSQIRVTNGAAMRIRGANAATQASVDTAAVALQKDVASVASDILLYSDASGGPISVSTFGANASNSISLEKGTVTAEASTVTMDTPLWLFMDRADIRAGGQIDLRAGGISMVGSTVSSSASGEAIWLRGAGALRPGIDSFSNVDSDGNDNPDALSAPNGRWIVWGYSVLPQSAFDFHDGGLRYDFKRYGVTDVGSWAADGGNGFVFSAGQTASVSLSTLDKAYDGSAAAQLSGGSAAGVVGDNGSLRPNATAGFADKNAGTGKTVSLTSADPFAMFDSQGKPVYGYTFTGTGSATITRAQLMATQIAAQDKVYDATTRATVSVSAITGLIGNETVVVNTQAAFGDKNVGTGKTLSSVQFSLADGSNGGLASNYVFNAPDVSYRADITPLLISISGLAAANKVYDASTGASITGNARVTPLAGDQLTLSGTGAGQFSDKNVGTAKSVALTGLSLGGADAGNYILQPVSLQADITPAPLLYVADATTRIVGTALTGLGGQVSGFVGGESLATATTGTLQFSGAPSATTVGTHAIQGSGLSAQNYQFNQAVDNAQALQLLASPTDGGGASADTSVHAAVQTLQLPVPPRSPLISGLADLSSALPQSSVGSSATPAPASTSTTASTPEATKASASTAASSSEPATASPATSTPKPASASDFGSVRLGNLSLGDLQGLLDARDRYKKTVFAESISKLEQDPSLADMKPCTSLGAAAAGGCMITEALKAQAQAEGAAVVTPTPAPSAAAAAPVPPPAPRFLSKRRVQTASLPQIERKVALLIGVNRYADASIPPLANAVGDAQALGRLFESKLGYETLLVEDASKATVVAALNRLALELGPRDSVLVYYAGHGELIESTGQGYWQLTDSDAKKPETWLSNADIARLVQQIGASQVALISDSCFSGSLAEGERIRATPGQLDAGQLLTHKAVVAMSSGGNEPVFDAGKGGHSPFAWSLMQSLGQVANWQPGGNVFERVRFAVARELPQRPRYSAAAGHQRGGDYLFEQRQLAQRN